jgi:zinc transport system substrate-binding protein
MLRYFLWLRSPFMGLGCVLLWPLLTLAEVQVVASIKPIYALVAGIMQGVGEPTLLVQGGASPHDYSLRPSDMRAINQAQIVFWVGPDLESFLIKPLANVGAKTRTVALMQAPGVEVLPLREGGAWEAHHHDHDEHSEQGQKQEASHDAHIWLDPVNAIAMVRQIVSTLGEVDTSHRAEYQHNGAQLITRLEQLNQELAQQLLSIKDQPYIVFHDAYQYFERRYQLHAVGSVVVRPEQRPSAKRVAEIQARVRNSGVRCVFTEPQFQPTLVETVIAGSGARRGVLDPLGAELPANSEAYFKLLQALTLSLKACLSRD